MKIEDFLKKLIGLMRGLQTLHCQIFTYRSVVGCEDGPMALESPGLSIHISGGPGQSLETMRSVVLHADVEPANREAHKHLDEAWSKVPVSSVMEQHLLFVAYAGAHAFEKTLTYLEIVRQSHPSATIVVVSCDCRWPTKWHSLEPLLANGVIDHVVKTRNCGGAADLLEIIEAVISSWDARNQS